MGYFVVGMRVRVIERVDSRYGQVGTLTLVDLEVQCGAVRFDDGDEQGYLLDDDEIEPVED